MNESSSSIIPGDVRKELDELKALMDIQDDEATFHALRTQQHDTSTMSFIQKKFPSLMEYIQQQGIVVASHGSTASVVEKQIREDDKLSYDVLDINISIHRDYIIIVHNLRHEQHDLMLGINETEEIKAELCAMPMLETFALLFTLKMHGQVDWSVSMLSALNHRLNLNDIGAVYHYLNPQGIAMLIKTLSETKVSIPNLSLPEFPRIKVGGLLLPGFLDTFQVRKPPLSMTSGPKPYSDFKSTGEFQDVTLSSIMSYFSIGGAEGRIQMFYDLCASLLGELQKQRDINYVIKNFDGICDKFLYRGKALNDVIRCRIDFESQFPSGMNGSPRISRTDYNGLGYKVLTEILSVSCLNGASIVINIEYQCMKERKEVLSNGDHFLYEMQRLAFKPSNLERNSIPYEVVSADLTAEEFNDQRLAAVEAELFGDNKNLFDPSL